MPKNVFWKQAVPANTVLKAQVSTTADPDLWTANLYLRRKDGTLLQLTNSQLRSGAPGLPLTGSDPENYIGQLMIEFAGLSSARVSLLLEKPNGTPHGKPYNEIHSGSVADSVAIMIFMGDV